jgi:hypothetical protein
MKPLILNYLEEPKGSILSFDDVIYSKELNLTVFKDTHEPAIKHARMATETFTRTLTEESDSDRDRLKFATSILDTSTGTFVSTETSDSDNDRQKLLDLLDTTTLTESLEDSDTDR